MNERIRSLVGPLPSSFMKLFVFLLLLVRVYSKKDAFSYKLMNWDDEAARPHIETRSAFVKSQSVVPPRSNDDMAIGTSFVYSYINAHISAKDQTYTENLYLTITNPGSTLSTVTITSQFPGFNTTTITVPPQTSQVTQIFPASIQVDYMDTQVVVNSTATLRETKSIWVSATSPVKLVATNQLSDGGGEDKFAVLPICQLGNNYLAVVDDSARVVGSKPSTNIITIIATVDLTSILYYGGGGKATVINKGQQFSIITMNPQSGIPIQTSQPVAVISGAVCGYGLYQNPQLHCSHESLMLFPTTAYDTHYPFYIFRPEDYMEVMLYVVQDNTTISLDGYPIGTINTNQLYFFKIYTGVYFTADKPIYPVAVGTINKQDQGAPFFAHIPAPSMFTGGPVIFATALTDDEAKNMVHYARVVTDLNNIGSVSVDGYYPNGLLYTRMGKSNYYFVDVLIGAGTHRVQGLKFGVTFAVTVYGYGDFRSYAFNPALNLPPGNGAC